MSKAIMIADKPIWCAKIMNGDKSIEVRSSKALYKATKKLIEEQGYATFLMYCTKDNKYCLVRNNIKRTYHLDTCYWDGYESNLNGKVVAKFTVRKVEEIEFTGHGVGNGYHPKETSQYEMSQRSCLFSFDEIHKYLKGKNGYAYHIEDLVIFDKPKELSEFKHICPNIMCDKCNYADLSIDKCLPICSNQLKKAPQNFCYVESEE